MTPMFVPHLCEVGAFGNNLFAYLPKRGARDALAFVILTWILEWCCGNKIAVYCSDVSGAFDKVKADILLRKLNCYGVESSVLAVLGSWLEARHANIIVEGQKSKTMMLDNMVYQGTVFGPPL